MIPSSDLPTNYKQSSIPILCFVLRHSPTPSPSSSWKLSRTMSYTDDAVKAKLSALNETQESIVTVAQWVMFHRLAHPLYLSILPLLSRAKAMLIAELRLCRRHADRTAQLWLQKIRESNPPKRLNLIYLANGGFIQETRGEGDIHILTFDPYPSGRGRATIQSKAEARFPHCFLASEFAYQSCFHVLFDPSAHRIC